MAVRAKRFTYDVMVATDGATVVGDGPATAFDESWTPEHLVLAGLARCTIASLRFECGRRGIAVDAAAAASGVVTLRESDGRYALVEARCALDVTLDPAPAGEELSALLGRAQRGCFVGASLTAPVAYVWRVNGSPATAQLPASGSQA